MRRSNPTTSFKLRYESVTGVLVLLNDVTMPALQDKIDMIKNGYRVNEAVIKARNSVIFDDFRHPEFPDDVLLYFVKEGVRPEGIWCRFEDEIEGRPAVKMLNEPNADFGVHYGDMITFDWGKQDGKMIGVAVLP